MEQWWLVCRDKETPYLVEKFHSKDGTKVNGRVRRWWYRWLTTLALAGKLNTMTREGLVTENFP
jgi:hypothetical protein